jgi:arylsulfatase A-like enzyme
MRRFAFITSFLALQFFAALTTLAETRGPNVLFIAIEDFNPAHIGAYGGKAITPNIDKLAQQSLVFDKAYVQFPVCGPSRAALLSGLRPPTTGVFSNADDWREIILPKYPTSMPAHFKNNGYEAVKVGKLFHWRQEHPESWSRELKTPVDGARMLSSYSDEVVAVLESLDPIEGQESYFITDLQWGPVDCGPWDFRDGQSVRALQSFLKELREKPFFAAVGFHAPHIKFAAPQQFFDLYDVDAIELPETVEGDWEDMPKIHGKNPVHSVMSDHQWRSIIRAQFACMSYVDWCVGQVMEALASNGLDEDTIVVLWTDHGYLLGEHFEWSKGDQKLFEETTKTAYMWKVPGMTPQEGARTSAIVESIDTFPTLFELCGIPIPEYIDGTSFVPVLRDPTRSWKEAAFTWGSDSRLSIQTARYRFNTDVDLDPASYELYDHESDPKEFVNVSADPNYASVIKRMQGIFRDYAAEHLRPTE